MANTIFVKPNPDKPSTISLKHPVSGGLLDAAGNVPAEGRAWLYDGFTCSLLVARAVIRADDPIFAVASAPADEPAAMPPPEVLASSLTPGPTSAAPSAVK